MEESLCSSKRVSMENFSIILQSTNKRLARGDPSNGRQSFGRVRAVVLMYQVIVNKSIEQIFSLGYELTKGELLLVRCYILLHGDVNHFIFYSMNHKRCGGVHCFINGEKTRNKELEDVLHYRGFFIRPFFLISVALSRWISHTNF